MMADLLLMALVGGGMLAHTPSPVKSTQVVTASTLADHHPRTGGQRGQAIVRPRNQKLNSVVHPAYVIGGLVLVASWPLRFVIDRTDWWFPMGESVAQLGRVMFG